jgi:di/tricarboxylate transporter
MPDFPSIHAAAALLLMLVSFVLFAMGRVRIELICLGLIAALALGFYFFPFVQEGRFTSMEVAFGGFSHEALVAICCLMILGRGLLITGALEPATRGLTRLWRFSRTLGLLSTILACFTMSMFVNDTPVLVLTLPILLSLSGRAGIAASKTLMPANCAILIGGMATTIGTSTNILVVSIAQDLGAPEIGLFDFAPIVLVAALLALPYLWLVMPRLLPAIDTTTHAARRLYEAFLHVGDRSRATGKSIAEISAFLGPGIEFSGVLRQGIVHGAADAAIRIARGDRLLVTGTPEALREASDGARAPLASEEVLDRIRANGMPRAQPEQRMAELVIGSESNLIGQSIKAARIADRYGIAVLGTSRAEPMPFRAGSGPAGEDLAVGDVLLVQGSRERLVSVEIGEGALLLEGGLELPHTAKAAVAILIVAGVILLAALKVVPIAIAALAGTIAMLATGCVSFESIGRALRLEVIVLVAASIALGRALVETGAAQWLGTLFAFALEGLPPAAALAALMIFTTVLTNFVSNAAAAAVGTPIAISMAGALGSAAEPFVLAVLFGCNLSYVTPMAYQTNLLIMSAARYRFADFVRAGLPLAILMITVLAYLLVRRYSM